MNSFFSTCFTQVLRFIDLELTAESVMNGRFLTIAASLPPDFADMMPSSPDFASSCVCSSVVEAYPDANLDHLTFPNPATRKHVWGSWPIGTWARTVTKSASETRVGSSVTILSSTMTLTDIGNGRYTLHYANDNGGGSKSEMCTSMPLWTPGDSVSEGAVAESTHGSVKIDGVWFRTNKLAHSAEALDAR